MSVNSARVSRGRIAGACLTAVAAALVAVAQVSVIARAADGPKSAEELARRYVEAFNKKDTAALSKLRYPTTVKSELQDFIDQMSTAELESGTKYTSFEVKPIEPDKDKPAMGPDGKFYKPNLKPTNVVKVTAKTENGSSSSSFPVGQKDGIFYLLSVVPADGPQPEFKFGWQRFSAPAASWSVLMPNEPEPGRAALELEGGKDALKDPDAYGVVKNTADIKTYQHFFLCGEEGKRQHDEGNKEIYRATCTTYEPETLKKWFADPKKTLDEQVDYRVRNEGELVARKEIELSGAPGRAFEIRGKDGSVSIARVYWVKDALYELTVESKKDKPDRAAAEKFLSSLEVK